MEKHKVKIRLNAFVIALLAVVVCISGFARAAEQPSPKLTLISNVDIFDGKTEKLHENMHVLVKDNLIDTVSSEPLAIIQTDNVTMIEGDPTKDIRLLMDADKNIDLIMSDGKIYKNTL